MDIAHLRPDTFDRVPITPNIMKKIRTSTLLALAFPAVLCGQVSNGGFEETDDGYISTMGFSVASSPSLYAWCNSLNGTALTTELGGWVPFGMQPFIINSNGTSNTNTTPYMRVITRCTYDISCADGGCTGSTFFPSTIHPNTWDIDPGAGCLVDTSNNRMLEMQFRNAYANCNTAVMGMYQSWPTGLVPGNTYTVSLWTTNYRFSVNFPAVSGSINVWLDDDMCCYPTLADAQHLISVPFTISGTKSQAQENWVQLTSAPFTVPTGDFKHIAFSVELDLLGGNNTQYKVYVDDITISALTEEPSGCNETCPWDLNNDGIFDQDDTDIFYSECGGNANQSSNQCCVAVDFNGDGTVNQYDAQIFNQGPPGGDCSSGMIQFGAGGESEASSVRTNDVKLEPNPSPGLFRVVAVNSTDALSELTVRDLRGQLVHAQQGSIAPGTVVDLSAQPVGAYFVSVLVNGKTQTLAIMKE